MGMKFDRSCSNYSWRTQKARAAAGWNSLHAICGRRRSAAAVRGWSVVEEVEERGNDDWDCVNCPQLAWITNHHTFVVENHFVWYYLVGWGDSVSSLTYIVDSCPWLTIVHSFYGRQISNFPLFDRFTVIMVVVHSILIWIATRRPDNERVWFWLMQMKWKLYDMGIELLYY